MTDSNLVLQNVVLRVGGGFINQADLDEDVRNWKGIGLTPRVGRTYRDLPDLALIRVLGHFLMPFTLIATQPTYLDVELACFPYSYNGKQNFQVFACRMVSTSDSAITLQMHKRPTVVVSNLIISNHLATLDTGNGSLHIEIYFNNLYARILSPLEPPYGFEAEINDPDLYP